LRTCFAGHRIDTHIPFTGARPYGDVARAVSELEVAVVEPGPKAPGLWAYISIGCWDAVHDGEHGLEFVILAPRCDARCELLLAMVATYHASPRTENRLDWGHTVPIGEPWLDDSACDHLLVSLPYPLGPEFESAHWNGGHARILWLLPITSLERDFKAEHGIEALEERFDAGAIAYWDPARPSVV
jgi:hypothetical protein